NNKQLKILPKPAQYRPPATEDVMRTLLQAESIEIVAEYEPQKGVASTKAALGELYLPLAGLIDVDAERARLDKELEKIEAEIAKVEQKLANPNFVQKVP